MASNPDLVRYIAEQCSGAGEIMTKKMFGDYALYCEGKVVGLICDDHLYIKPTDETRKLLHSVDLRPPYDGAKDYFHIDEIDDRDYLTSLVKATYDALPAAKPKKKKG